MDMLSWRIEKLYGWIYLFRDLFISFNANTFRVYFQTIFFLQSDTHDIQWLMSYNKSHLSQLSLSYVHVLYFNDNSEFDVRRMFILKKAENWNGQELVQSE